MISSQPRVQEGADIENELTDRWMDGYMDGEMDGCQNLRITQYSNWDMCGIE